MQLPIHSYRIGTASTARLVNCYAQANATDGKSPLILRRSPGVTLDSTGAGNGRGLCVMGGGLYAVIGFTLYSVAPNGALTSVGTVPGLGRVHMAANTYQLVIVANGDGYVYSAVGGLAQITDPDYRLSSGCCFVDNYILFSAVGSGQFFGSGLALATSFDALDFATAEGAPDNLVTIAADHRQAILLGTETTEIWQNTGIAGFPFERVPNGMLEIGIAGEHLKCKQDNTLFWVANDRTARKLEGGTPLKISSAGVENAWASYDMTGGYAFAYSFEGHLCAAFVFPTEQAAWTYDATTGEWHERESEGSTWKAVGACTAYGSTWVLASDGRLGRMNLDSGTEWGTAIRSEWTYQPIVNAGRSVYHKTLTLGVESGGSGDYDLVPTLSMDISNDGGRTWFAGPVMTLGRRGEYLHRVRFDRLGMARQRVYRMSIADDVPLLVTSADLEAA